MAPSPGWFFDHNALDADFEHSTLARGAHYADQGRVVTTAWSRDGLTLTGTCSGSGGRVYSVTADFELIDDEMELIWTDCTCPVGVYCKHAAALLLTAAVSGPRVEPPDRWRTVLSKVLEEMGTPDSGGGSPVGLEFSIAAPTRYRAVASVAVRPVTLGKRGTWIKTGLGWSRLLYDTDAHGFDRRQYLAVRALGNELQRSAPIVNGAAAPIATARPAFWPLLDAAVDAGVTTVADKASGLVAVDFVKSPQLRLDFASDDSGGAVMSVVLSVDGEECDPREVGLIGSPAPSGMYVVADGTLRLGRFDPTPGPTALDLIARGEQLRIPAETVPEFVLDLLPRLADVAPLVIEEGLFAPPKVTGPAPVLIIELTDVMARAFWSTRYEVNDAHHDFDPDSPPQQTGFRDADAEHLAWEHVLPALRTVASASGTWKRQAAAHLQRLMARRLDATVLAEQRAIDEAIDASGAAAAASPATLRSAVDLTLAEVAVLCTEVLPGLDCRDAFTVEVSERMPNFRAASTEPQVAFGSGDRAPARNDWFDLDITVQVEGHQVPVASVITELASGATHMLLPDGVYFRLDTPELLRLRELLDEARALGEIDGDRVNAGSYNATLWEELLTLGVVDQQLGRWRQSLARLTTARPPEPVEVPDGLDVTLRDYQRDGLNWLWFLWHNGLGGVLADDMGLGKTVQTIALIARIIADEGPHRFLVVAPTSVVTNWAAECAKFAPDLTAVAISSTEGRSGLTLADQAATADIVITSYALLRIDFEAYAGIDWAGMILDEAQFVKNHNSKTHQCARRLDAGFKLAITGTPMENNLMELWSLLSITAPGLFPSPKAFNEYFRKPIESGANSDRLAVLRRRIKPMMLRRTKSQVASDLPPKQEQVLTIDLSAKHRKLYDTRMARERQKVLGLLGDWEKNRFQVFRSLTLLRQLSLHPGMIDETNADAGSAKVEFLVEQLPALVAEGHSALVFSQFTSFLSILRTHLDAVGISYSYLDGSSSARQREAAVRMFRTGVNQVFLISLKAGGFGLNLTEADYCFVTDPWWSPAAEAQAVDRAHRIGQRRPVTVYRLVSQGTIEEKVVALQDRKRKLFSAVVDDGAMFGSGITASDVRALLG
ncbi:MAG: SNF2-related protein [Mycobacterium sp.]